MQPLAAITEKSFSENISPHTAENIETMGPLHDPVTWYGINYTGTQITQWDFRNKGKSGWTGTSSLFWKSHCVTCVPV